MHKPTTPLYFSSDIRKLESVESGGSLMARAGLALAALAGELAGETSDPILIVAGPGNNGGDALVAARHLKQRWYQVIVVLAGDPASMPADAADAHKAWLAEGGSCIEDIPSSMRFSLALDGLFGIGLKRFPEGHHARLINEINQLSCPVISIDVPSGLDADTGQVHGCAVTAGYTLTFLAAKPGLYTLDGPDHAGTVIVSDLGIDATGIAEPRGWLLEERMFHPALPPRPRNSHKGLFGNVAVIGGSEGMVGAALLAGRAALLCGGGRVYAGLLAEDAPLLDPLQPELMLRHATDLHEKVEASCAVIGPGLGRSPQAVSLLKVWLGQPVPLVLDADALQLIGQNPALKAVIRQRSHPTIMTPHPGEAAALAGCDNREIQQDRMRSALKLADEYNAVILLKGAGTVIVEPGGNWHINPTGNPGLASAGTGDVLAGMLGAFIAQGLSATQATCLAAWLHGAAADELVAHGTGPVGLTASEIALKARTLINRSFLEPEEHQQSR
jgi:hydroxyethylthiazole kinase-like uncharacterized protein yjeF